MNRPASSWRGVIAGAVVGLALIAIFVAGNRLAQSHASTTANVDPAVPAVVVARPPIPAKPPAEVPTKAPDSALATAPAAATAGTLASPVAIAPIAHPPAAPTPVATFVPRQTAVVAGAPRPAPPATNAPVPASPVEPTPEEQPQSLVPVIPPSAPPPRDPLVKAVQLDIQEEQSGK